jgi:L-cysteine S-thiosulfotransferase
MKTRKLVSIVGLLGVALVSGCKTYPDYSMDFRFPIFAGDIQRGQQAFVSLECHQCHVVDGVELPSYPGGQPVTVELGGELVFAKTYGDLATSIINPDHVISDRYLRQLPRAERRSATSSPMYLKEEMKVTELIDIVTFLNSRYSLLPGYTEYYY